VSWLSERSRNGGVDEIPLPAGPGRLWLAGKHFVAPDPDGVLDRLGADCVVCLTELHELDDRYPDYVAWLRANQGERAVLWPIADLHAPGVADAEALLDVLRDRLDQGEGLVVHCGAGVGRAGTVAVALLVSMGLDLDRALAVVAAHRPMAGPEAGAQRALLDELATRVTD
jgi:protein-tyrosine phosphatase